MAACVAAGLPPVAWSAVVVPITKWATVDTKGNWNILAAPPGTATGTRCVAIYGSNYAIQLTGDGLTLAYGTKGGIDHVRWRLDDGKTHEAVVLGKARDLGAFVFADDGEHAPHVFAQIIEGHLLHVELTKVVGDPETIDLALAGIRATMDVLWGSRCQ